MTIAHQTATARPAAPTAPTAPTVPAAPAAFGLPAVVVDDALPRRVLRAEPPVPATAPDARRRYGLAPVPRPGARRKALARLSGLLAATAVAVGVTTGALCIVAVVAFVHLRP